MSIEGQTYKHFEVVVSDDASADTTMALVKAFKKRNKFPVTILNHTPQGIGANWNNCIEHVQGDYIKFLFQDDVLEPTCVEAMVAVFEKYPSVGLVGSKRQFILEASLCDEATKKWVTVYGDLQQHIPYVKKDNADMIILDKSLFKAPNFFRTPKNKIGEPSTFMFKSSLLNKVGLFREDMKQALDYEFCYRVLKTCEIAILKRPLCKFRLHDKQATQHNKGNDQGDYEVYRKLMETEYFWYLERRQQLAILRRRYKFVDGLLQLKAKLIMK